MILACDVGGTSTRVALFEPVSDRAIMLGSETVRSAQYPSLESIVAEFRSRHPDPLTAACFGVAGPVSDGQCITTNLPWQINLKQLQATLAHSRVGLINDLVANAWGIDWLTANDVVSLHAGQPEPTGNRAVISPGTGLGEAGMICVDGRYRPFASEGGHAEFGPRSETQFDLARYLERRFGRTSYEHVLSGPGLVNIYTFLRNSARGDEPEWFAQELKRTDPAARIADAALNDELPMHLPGRNQRHDYGPAPRRASAVRDFYEEAYWSDLNKWMATFEPHVEYQFQRPDEVSEVVVIPRRPKLTQLQDEAVLEALRLLGVDPLRLPRSASGFAGIRKQVSERVSMTPSTFKRTWQRLRSAGLIQYSEA